MAESDGTGDTTPHPADEHASRPTPQPPAADTTAELPVTDPAAFVAPAEPDPSPLDAQPAAGPAHATSPSGPSRRWFVVGGVAVVLGAGAGVAGQFVHHRDTRPEPPPPAALVAAAAAERALIADLDATTGGGAHVRTAIVQIRANHAAHLRVLDALIAAYAMEPSRSGSPSATASPTGTPRTTSQLRAAEKRASTAAAGRGAALTGRVATVMASISACEATHAELLR